MKTIPTLVIEFFKSHKKTAYRGCDMANHYSFRPYHQQTVTRELRNMRSHKVIQGKKLDDHTGKTNKQFAYYWI